MSNPNFLDDDFDPGQGDTESLYEEKKINPKSPQDNTPITIYGQEISRESIPDILPSSSGNNNFPTLSNASVTTYKDPIRPRSLALSSQAREFPINNDTKINTSITPQQFEDLPTLDNLLKPPLTNIINSGSSNNVGSSVLGFTTDNKNVSSESIMDNKRNEQNILSASI